MPENEDVVVEVLKVFSLDPTLSLSLKYVHDAVAKTELAATR